MKSMQKNTITIPIEISIDALDEVITTALEGGSNYWYWINNDDLTKMSNWLEDQIKKGYLTRNNQIHYKWLDALFQGWFGKLAIYDKEEYYNLEIPDDFSKLEPIGYLSMENIIKKNILAFILNIFQNIIMEIALLLIQFFKCLL